MTVINLFHRTLFLLICFATPSLNLVQAEITFKSLNTANKNPAQAIQGGLLMGSTDVGNKVWLNNQNVRVASDGTYIIGFSRDATSVELRIELMNGEQLVESINIQPREYKIERVDGLPPSKVNPKGEAVLKRIREEAKQVKLVRKKDDARQDFKKGFVWPAKGRISGVYGSQRILNGEPKWPHFGIDVAAPTGTPVVTPASGIVTLTHSDMYYSGGTVIIDHGHGLSSTFLHLSEILVKTGDQVKQGDLVAKIGATGRATGPHLDWRVNWFGVRLDAELLVEAGGNKK